MYAWLNGPGKVFRDPLPSSTNYLSAYDRRGQLIRGKREEQAKYDDPELDENEATIQERELKEGVPEATVKKRAAVRERKRQERREMAERGGVPKERERDMRPYPLNQQFRSQPVLSEELRDKIYEQIVEEGRDIKDVSATYNVDIRRVAAVVRLKSLEKLWVAEVSLKPFFAFTNILRLVRFDDDHHSKIRLVLKTPTWLQNNALRASLILTLPRYNTQCYCLDCSG